MLQAVRCAGLLGLKTGEAVLAMNEVLRKKVGGHGHNEGTGTVVKQRNLWSRSLR